jgi:hypothetical protein
MARRQCRLSSAVSGARTESDHTPAAAGVRVARLALHRAQEGTLLLREEAADRVRPVELDGLDAEGGEVVERAVGVGVRGRGQEDDTGLVEGALPVRLAPLDNGLDGKAGQFRVGVVACTQGLSTFSQSGEGSTQTCADDFVEIGGGRIRSGQRLALMTSSKGVDYSQEALGQLLGTKKK